MISTVKNGTKRKIFEENERFYCRFSKGALLLRVSYGFAIFCIAENWRPQVAFPSLISSNHHFGGFFCGSPSEQRSICHIVASGSHKFASANLAVARLPRSRSFGILPRARWVDGFGDDGNTTLGGARFRY